MTGKHGHSVHVFSQGIKKHIFKVKIDQFVFHRVCQTEMNNRYFRDVHLEKEFFSKENITLELQISYYKTVNLWDYFFISKTKA